MLGLAFQEIKTTAIMKAYGINVEASSQLSDEEVQRRLEEAQKAEKILERDLAVLEFDEKGRIIDRDLQLTRKQYIEEKRREQRGGFLGLGGERKKRE